jgi:hypothetical protein
VVICTGTDHRWVVLLRSPRMIGVSRWLIVTWLQSNVATQPTSHSCPEVREEMRDGGNLGNYWDLELCCSDRVDVLPVWEDNGDIWFAEKFGSGQVVGGQEMICTTGVSYDI